MQCRSHPSRQLPCVSAFHHRNWADHSASSDTAPRSLAITPAVSRSAPKMSSSTSEIGREPVEVADEPGRKVRPHLVGNPPADDDLALGERTNGQGPPG